ncbi:MAG: type VI secretion lipoprotein TssJ [bacterium]|jgi:type VI secretion system VasD/TssJ family lipoprotein|nr:type VI secretion lipoprotein TssJ [Betaproteobacteria bacterium]
MPRRTLLVLAAAATLLLVAGCGSVNSMLGGNSEKEAMAALEWSYGKGAIRLDIQSDPKLNNYHGAPHTLVLGVAQFAEPNGFNLLLADPAAVARLLESGRGAPGVLAFERFVVAPGGTRTLTLDRAEKSQYVGVVAGYFEFDPLQNGRLFRIPVSLTSTGTVTRTRTAVPGSLSIRLVLGPQRLLAADTAAGKPGEPPKPPPDKPAEKKPAPKGPPGKAPAAKPPPTQPAAKADPNTVPVDLTTVRQAVDGARTVRRLAQ